MDIPNFKHSGYVIFENGEMDLRGCYCTLVIANLLDILPDPEITDGIAEFIASCQTYEGGISNMPYGEAHAGYTYCGLASMILLGKEELLDLDMLANWAAHR